MDLNVVRLLRTYYRAVVVKFEVVSRGLLVCVW